MVRGLRLPGLRMMVDTFHMNIEEKDMLAPLAGIGDILAHVHLSETNRDVLGQATGPRPPGSARWSGSDIPDTAPWACTTLAARVTIASSPA